MVHYASSKKSKALVVVNRPATHSSKPVGSKYQRGEILLVRNHFDALPLSLSPLLPFSTRTHRFQAGNIMEAVEGEPNQTRFTMITHVNPGGVVDNPLCAKIMNRLSASAPIDFVQKLEAAANR